MLSETQQKAVNSKPQADRVHVEAAGTLRVKFSKTGMIRYISHLDLLRTMQTALKRARIPVWYTEGFNPHPKMVFALPLSLGSESICELLDVRVTDRIDCAEAVDALNRAFPPDLRALDAYYAERKFTELCWARYELTPTDGGGIPNADVLDSAEIVTLKKTKSGEKEADIKPQIKDWLLSDDGKLTVTLRAAVNDFLSPDLVARVTGMGEHTTLRTAVLLDDGVTEFR